MSCVYVNQIITMIIVMQKEEMKMKKIKMRRERNLEVRDDFGFTQKKKKTGESTAEELLRWYFTTCHGHLCTGREQIKRVVVPVSSTHTHTKKKERSAASFKH